MGQRGVGKSTLALLLYEAFRQAGKTVLVHDWDSQGTSTKALALFDTIVVLHPESSSKGR